MISEFRCSLIVEVELLEGGPPGPRMDTSELVDFNEHNHFNVLFKP